jgi:hypothetical protein
MHMPYDGEPIDLKHVSNESIRGFLADLTRENVKLHRLYGDQALDLSYALSILEDIHLLQLRLPEHINDRLEALFSSDPF